MRRTRLFHTVVILGSSLLANCDKGSPPAATKARDASVKKDAAAPNIPIIDAPPPAKIVAQIDAGALVIDAGAPRPVRIMVAPPRIQAPPPVRIMVAPPPVRIMAAPRPRIMAAPPSPRI